MRLTCLAIASGFLVCITYLISNKKYQNALLNVQFHTNYENNNNNRFQDDMTARKIRQRSSTKQSFVAAFPQRARLVNDVGEIFADEQPDFNEIRALNIENSIITLKNKRHLDPTDKSASSAMSQQHVAQQNTSSVYRRPFGVVESDPHIDDNVVPISYKFYVNNNNIRYVCSRIMELRRLLSVVEQCLSNIFEFPVWISKFSHTPLITQKKHGCSHYI